jgi:hypothetical protein
MVTRCATNVESDFYGSLCGLLIIHGEYLMGISCSPLKRLVMLWVMEVGDKKERKKMKRATTAGFMAVFAGVLLATVTSASANHVATGKGTYAVAPRVLAEFHFIVAKPGGTNPGLNPGLNFVQSEMAGIGGSKPFKTVMISTAIDFTIPPESTETDERTVTIIGEMVSTTFLGAGEDRQPFAELVPFTAIGVDKRIPEAGADFFSLAVEYSASQAQGPLFASLGLGTCDDTTCRITFEGPVKRGDIFVHTAGGE